MGTDVHGVMQLRQNNKWKTVEVLDMRRNYVLFAVLANVRNGYGFAGVKTGEPLPHIDEARGIPEDLHDYINIKYEDSIYLTDGYKERHWNEFESSFWLGYHDHSWLSLTELLAYDWDYMGDFQGLVSPEIDKKTPKGHQPEMYCGGTSDKSYVLRKWKKPIRDCISDSFFAILEAYAQEYNPNDVRMVFGFDS